MHACSPVWARRRCRISPPRFLAECCKRQLNQVSLVLLYFRLSAFSYLYWVCLSVFSCTVLFVSISQVIGCEGRLRNDLYCVGWGVKLYSNIGIACIVCGLWSRVYAVVWRQSICPVCMPLLRFCCCCPAARRYWSITAEPAGQWSAAALRTAANVGSATL